MSLGQRIQALRKEAGLSQEALGGALGVSRQAVSKWESDGGVPELDTLIAISRLFGVRLGALLGVEPAAEPDAAAAAPEPETAEAMPKTVPALDEAALEAILRRYADETARRAQPRLSARTRKWMLLAAGLAVGALLIFGIRMGGRLSDLRSQANDLSARLAGLEQTMDERNIYLTERIQAILDEQNELLSSQSFRVTGFDPGKQTVTARLTARPKAYAPGTQARFVLSWTRPDGKSGETVSQWLDGPEFTAELTMPMNQQLDGLLRLRDASGAEWEVPLETRFDGMQAESFALEADGLTALFALSMEGSWASTRSETPRIRIVSPYPELFTPETARLTAAVNGKALCDWELEITAGDGAGQYDAGHPEAASLNVPLLAGDELTVTLTVTDSLGRVFTFTEGATATKNGMEALPMAKAG